MSRPTRALNLAEMLAAVLTSAGCALGPDYHRPAFDVPSQYRNATPDALAATAADSASLGDSDWAQVYSDRNLRQLLARAIQNNYDVKIAVARIDEARAMLGSTRLSYLPQVSADASVGRAKASNYVLPSGVPRIENEDRVQIEATYQIDLWGQLRRMNQAARANLLASQYAERAVRVTLVQTLASAYFALISLDSQLEIAQRTVESRNKFLELTRALHTGGYVTGLDVATAEAQLDAARATIPDLERQIGQSEDQISILVGANPYPVLRTHYGEAVPEAPPRPPPGLPARLLERRPDVLQAEQALVSANAEIGVARAALFPNIALTGSAGSISVPLGQLFSGPAAEWSAGVGLIQPLLSAQSNLYQVQLANGRKREALYQYQRTLQGAFQDVADALLAYQKYGELEREEDDQVDALRRAREIALARYHIGYASYFDVVTADSQLFTAELLLAQAYASHLGALVRLYSALGGGWQEPSAIDSSTLAKP
jgi:multidrug efflux system outer membrane protein